jgi:hypothetical protein
MTSGALNRRAVYSAQQAMDPRRSFRATHKMASRAHLRADDRNAFRNRGLVPEPQQSISCFHDGEQAINGMLILLDCPGKQQRCSDFWNLGCRRKARNNRQDMIPKCRQFPRRQIVLLYPLLRSIDSFDVRFADGSLAPPASGRVAECPAAFHRTCRMSRGSPAPPSSSWLNASGSPASSCRSICFLLFEDSSRSERISSRS